MAPRRRIHFIITIILVTGLIAYYREQLFGQFLYRQWQWVYKGQIDFGGFLITIPKHWWVYSRSDDEIVCMRLPPARADFITAVVTRRDIMPTVESLIARQPMMGLNGQLLRRLDPSERLSILNHTAHLITYVTPPPEKFSFFWVLPETKLTISVSNVPQSYKAYSMELVNSIVRSLP